MFFHKRALIESREHASKGFFPTVEWIANQGTLDYSRRGVEMTFFGEWSGNKAVEKTRVQAGEKIVLRKEMSSLSCVKLDHPASLAPGDLLRIRVKNNFKNKVPDFVNPNVNLNNAQFSWDLEAGSLDNLRVPKDYVVYWVGYIPLSEFAEKFQTYPSYFIPDPKNMDENVSGEVSNDFRDGLETYDRRRAKAIEAGTKTPWPELLPLIKG